MSKQFEYEGKVRTWKGSSWSFKKHIRFIKHWCDGGELEVKGEDGKWHEPLQQAYSFPQWAEFRKKRPREDMDVEFLDRLNTVLMLMDDLLVDHDSAVFYDVNDKINEASDILAQVYQAVGCKIVED